MVLGSVSKKLVSMVAELGIRAVGISGKDGNLLHVKRKYADGQDIGFVGEVCGVKPKILYDMLDNDYLPIVAPIGMDENFDTYNINADEAASAIARAVKADKLVYLTDIAGLYRDINDPDSFIPRITITEAEALIDEGIIGGGMLPKLANCTQAVRGGVHRVHILDGRIPHSMLLEFFTEKGIGTMFHLKTDTDMN
jgi:acetylglutamate kinase